jgi:hypothetical protein
LKGNELEKQEEQEDWRLIERHKSILEGLPT